MWLDASDIHTTRPSAKVSHRCLGPFKVVKVVSCGAFKLDLPPRYSSLHPVFPVVKLRLVEDDPFEGRPQNDEPPPVLDVPSDQQWEVDEILDAKIWWGSLGYMCSFKGYRPDHNKWVKHSDVFAPELVEDFYQRYPGKPCSISAATFDSLPFCARSARIQSMR